MTSDLNPAVGVWFFMSAITLSVFGSAWAGKPTTKRKCYTMATAAVLWPVSLPVLFSVWFWRLPAKQESTR